MTLLHMGDMLRMKELLTDYKFVISWEEERMMEISSKGNGTYKLAPEVALTNLLQLIQSLPDDGDTAMNGGAGQVNEGSKKTGPMIIDKPSQLICGSLEKRVVF